ncbi:MAG: hypothetical protein JSW43_04700, partial [Gemmatimonadota bacterium]
RMDFEIEDPEEPGLHKQFIRWVRAGNLGAIRGVLNAWQAQGLIRGERADSIVAQVKRPGPPRWPLR